MSINSRRKLSETLKSRGSRAGKNNSSWKGYWITPYGYFELLDHAAKVIPLHKETIRKKCNNADIKDWYRSKEIPQ